MAGELVSYVVQQYNSGYGLDQIKGFLIGRGYNKKAVEADLRTAIDQIGENFNSYIGQQDSAGYSLPQIRQYLIQNRYDYRIVDSALRYYSRYKIEKEKEARESAKNNQQVQQTAIKKQVQPAYQQIAVQQQNPAQNSYNQQITKTNFQNSSQNNDARSLVKNLLDKGFSLENAQSMLVSQGYDFNDISSAVNSFRQSHIHFPKAGIFAGIAVVLAVALFFSFGNLNLFGENRAGRVMDFELEYEGDEKIYPGDSIRFMVEAINMGSDKSGYDVYYTYYLENSDGEIISEKTDSKILGDRTSQLFTLDVPDDAEPGNYRVWVIADYVDDKARASMLVRVDGEGSDHDDEPEPVDNTNEPEKEEDQDDPEKTDDPLKETDDSKDDDAKPEEKPKSETIYNKWTDKLSQDVINNIKNQAGKDPDYAVFLCSEMQKGQGQEACLRLVAETTDDRKYCNLIEDKREHDLCHMDFAKDSKDRNICEDIDDRNLKSTCKALVLANKYKEMYSGKTKEDIIDYISAVGD